MVCMGGLGLYPCLYRGLGIILYKDKESTNFRGGV